MKLVSEMLPSKSELLKEALDAAQAIQKEFDRFKALLGIAPQLSEATPELLKQALEAAQDFQKEYDRNNVLEGVVRRLSEAIPELLKQALDTAQAIQDEYYRRKALAAITHQLSHGGEKMVAQYASDQLSGMLDLVEAATTDAKKVRILSTTVPRLSLGLLPKALQFITQATIQDELLRVEALSNIAPYLLTDQFTEALELCQPDPISPKSTPADCIPFKYEVHRAKAISHLLPYLETLKQYERALVIIKDSIPDHIYQAETLKAFAAELTTERFVGMIISTPYSRINLSKDKSKQTPQERCSKLADDIWRMLEELPGDSYIHHRATILGQLVPAMSIDQVSVLQESLSTAFKYQDEESPRKDSQDTGYVARLLSIIAIRRQTQHPIYAETDSQITDAPPGTIISNDIQLVEHSLYDQVLVRTRIPEFISLAVDCADNQIQSPFEQAEAWVEIANYSSSSEHHYTALQNISRLPNTYLQSQYLQRLVPHLHPSQQSEAARVAKAISQPYYSAQALIVLAGYFPNFRPDAESAAEALEDIVQMIEQLSRLAVEMPSLLPKIIRILTEPKTPSNDQDTDTDSNADWSKIIERKRLLVALATHLPMRINREVERAGITDTFSQLWRRALYLLARGYRDALNKGTLQNESLQGEDSLNLKDEVDALADLLLMRDLEPPMAVGILGGRGGGKSYIMHLMQQHMTQVRSRKVEDFATWNDDPNHERLSPYVGHIYQIKFDAWTFTKSDLWASLMQTIFFELDRQISLEQQLAEALANNDKSEAQVLCEAGQFWSVLYESSEEERQYLLQKAIQDKELCQALEMQSSRGELWKLIAQVRQEDQKKLAETQNELKTKQKQLATERQQVRQRFAAQFEPILKLQADERVKWADAFFGTSFIVLKRRIGKDLFEQLNKQIFQELYGQSDTFESALSTTGIIADTPTVLGEWALTTPPPADTDTEAEEPKTRSADGNRNGLWGQLHQQLKTLEQAQQDLWELESENFDQVATEDEENATAPPELASDAEASDTNQSAPNNPKETDPEKLKKEIEESLQKITSIRFDILNVATTVVERNYWPVLRATICRWTKSNSIPLLIVVVFNLLPIGLLFLFDFNANQSALAFIAKLGALIAPALPAATLLMKLLTSMTIWFEESRLALSEYETSVTKQNREREERIKASIEQLVAQNSDLQQLEREVNELEQQVKAQAAMMPTNQYATLTDFISARLETGDYEQRLGLMHQVKADLLDLSNKLLPPKHYDPKFKTQIDNLAKVFLRGPARVVVYIDDLDRCPPTAWSKSSKPFSF